MAPPKIINNVERIDFRSIFPSTNRLCPVQAVSMTDSSLPITGLCIVEQTCPVNYIVIEKCEDNTRVEADLWKDHLFSKKVKRFLCFTRTFPLAGGVLNNVVIDLSIQDEKDSPPPDYSPLHATQDTNEPAIKKKILSAKMVPRSQAKDAITDIMFLCKLKKAPPGYTLAGELNGLLLCFKIGKVPTQSAPPPIPPRIAYEQPTVPQLIQQQQQTYNPYSNNTVQSAIQGRPGYQTAPAIVNVATVRQQSTRTHPLSGVPFEINSKLSSSGNQRMDLDGFTFKSRATIMNEFDYSFTVERLAQQTSANFNGI